MFTFIKTVVALTVISCLAQRQREDAATDLEKAFHKALSSPGAWSKTGSELTEHLSDVESMLATSFSALPQTEGRIGQRAALHLMDKFFHSNLAWSLSGLQLTSDHTQSLEHVAILQQKAPKLAKVVAKSQERQPGLSLPETAAFVAVLKRMMMRESRIVLKAAWRLHNHSASAELSLEDTQEVLQSCMILLHDWSTNMLDDEALKAGPTPAMHAAFARQLEKSRNSTDNWENIKAYVLEKSKKLPAPFNYQAVLVAFFDIFEGFGQWQNNDCIDMRTHLRSLDKTGSGRVPLKSFYAVEDGSKYWFSESPKHLHKLGMLDNTDRASPSVLIANYVEGPTSCLSNNPLFSACCINGCTGLTNQIEAAVKAPTATAATMLSAVANISEVRAVPISLARRLEKMEENGGGKIHLHGRLFAQWMHYLEPYRCAFPSEHKSSATWYKVKAYASSDERSAFVDALPETTWSKDDDLISQWSDEEFLPLETVLPAEPMKNSTDAETTFGTKAQVALLLGAFGLIVCVTKVVFGGLPLPRQILEEELLAMDESGAAKPTCNAKGKGKTSQACVGKKGQVGKEPSQMQVASKARKQRTLKEKPSKEEAKLVVECPEKGETGCERAAEEICEPKAMDISEEAQENCEKAQEDCDMVEESYDKAKDSKQAEAAEKNFEESLEKADEIEEEKAEEIEEEKAEEVEEENTVQEEAETSLAASAETCTTASIASNEAAVRAANARAAAVEAALVAAEAAKKAAAAAAEAESLAAAAEVAAIEEAAALEPLEPPPGLTEKPPGLTEPPPGLTEKPPGLPELQSPPPGLGPEAASLRQLAPEGSSEPCTMPGFEVMMRVGLIQPATKPKEEQPGFRPPPGLEMFGPCSPH